MIDFKPNYWRSLGSWQGGSVHALALSPNFVGDGVALATTSAGIFRTVDSGRHWSLAIDGFVDPAGLAITFAPDSASIAFASSPQGRLYASYDGGLSWHGVESWSGLGVGTTITLSPTYTQDKTLFVATSEGIFRSLNGGSEWQEASFGLLDLNVLCLLCAPDFGESETLWVGTALGGLYRSRNAGRAWRETGAGLPDCAIQSIAFSASYRQDHTLFIGTEEDGVYVSHDDGASWQPAGRALTGLGVNALATSLQISQQAQISQITAATTAGLFRSEDGDDSWQKCEGEPLVAFDVKAAANGVGIAGLYQHGIARTSDGGKIWQLAAGALVAHAPPVVAVAQNKLFLLDETGAVTAFDSAQKHWVALPALPETEIIALAAAGAETTHTLFVSTAQRLYRLENETSEHGSTTESEHPSTLYSWQDLSLGSEEIAQVEGIAQLAVSPGYAIDGTLLVAQQDGQLYLSVDSGKTWQPRALPWRRGNSPQPAETLLQLLISPFFVVDGMILAVGAHSNQATVTQLSIWQSVDRGRQWESLATFESAIPSVLAALPIDSTEHAFFLSTQHRLIKLYTDSAGQLAVEQFFFAEDDSITALTVSPTYENDRTLYIATRQGIHISNDSGTTWRPFAPAFIRPVVALVVQSPGNRLVAVTLGGEIWECSLAGEGSSTIEAPRG